MKEIIGIILLICIAVFESACNQGNQQPALVTIDTPSIIASIDSLAGVVQKAHDTRDDKLLASAWAKDGILVMAGSPPVEGREAIVSALSKMPALPPGASMKIYPKEIQVLSPEWVYVLGVDSLKYTLHEAGKDTVETTTFFVLVRKTPEGWQTYRETLTPNQPPVIR